MVISSIRLTYIVTPIPMIPTVMLLGFAPRIVQKKVTSGETAVTMVNIYVVVQTKQSDMSKIRLSKIREECLFVCFLFLNELRMSVLMCSIIVKIRNIYTSIASNSSYIFELHPTVLIYLSFNGSYLYV